MSLAEVFAGPSFPEAKCKGTYDDFFQDSEMELEKVAREKIAICFTCPHRAQCLEFALENREVHGIWGGTTPAMRRRTLRAKNEGINYRSTTNEARIISVVRAIKSGLTPAYIAKQWGLDFNQVSRAIKLAKQRKLL